MKYHALLVIIEKAAKFEIVVCGALCDMTDMAAHDKRCIDVKV